MEGLWFFVTVYSKSSKKHMPTWDKMYKDFIWEIPTREKREGEELADCQRAMQV